MVDAELLEDDVDVLELDVELGAELLEEPSVDELVIEVLEVLSVELVRGP